MTRIATIVTGVFFAGLLAGCVPAASDQEIAQMCENLVKLRGEVDLTPLEQRLVKIDEEFAGRKADIEKRFASALEAVARETEARIAELGGKATPEERDKIEQDGAARKAEAKVQQADALSKLDPDREARVADAKAKSEKEEAAAAEKIAECTKKAKDEGVSQALAKCRAEADSTDKYWNRCR
jgi:hypothetical protein